MHRTIFTHRFFGTEKNRHRENCTHRLHKKKYTPFLFASRNFTQNSFYTAETLPHRSFYGLFFLNAQQLLQTDGFYTESSPYRSLTHRRFYAQHFFTYRRFYTQMPLHGRQIAHRNLCTQHTFTRNQLLHREVLFLLLDHLPFVFSLSSGYIVICKCYLYNYISISHQPVHPHRP